MSEVNRGNIMDEEDFYSDLENEKVTFPLGQEYGDSENDHSHEQDQPKGPNLQRMERLLKGDSPEALQYQQELMNVAYQLLNGTFDAKKYYGITDEMIDFSYGMGVELYKNKQYEKAMDVFSVLSVLDPRNIKVMKAKGSCCFQLNDFASSREYFRQAIAAGEYTIKNFMRVVETSFRLQDADVVKKAAEEIIQLAHKAGEPLSKEDAGIVERAIMFLEILSRSTTKEEDVAQKLNDE